MKMNFTITVVPPFVHPMMSLPATPTLFGNIASLVNLLGGDVAKYGNLKRCESLLFSGDRELRAF